MSRRSGGQSTEVAHELLRAVGVLVAVVAAFFVLSALRPSTASAAGSSDDGTDSPLLGAAASLLDPVTEPVIEAAAPVAEPVLEAAAPVVAVAAPVIEPVAAVAAPVVQVVVEPVAAVAAPVVAVAAPVIEPVAEVVAPVVAVAGPAVEPVAEVVAPVVAVAAPVIEPVAEVVAPVVAVAAPAVEPVAEVVAPLVESAVERVAEVVAPLGEAVRSLIQTTDMANLIDMMVGTVDDTVRATTGPVLDRVGTVVTDVGARVEAVTGGVSDIVNEVGQQADSVLPNPTVPTVPNWPSHPTWPERQPDPASVAPSPASETDVIDPTTQALLARWQTSPSMTAGTTFAAPSARDTSGTIRPSDTSVTMLDGVEFGTTAKALSGPLTGAAIAIQITGSSAGGAPSGRDQNPPHVAVLSSSAGGVSWHSRGVTTDVSWTSASVSLSIECPG